MATNHDFSALSKKKLTTYGKPAGKKKQQQQQPPKSPFESTAAHDDSTSKPKAAATRRRLAPAPSPLPDPPSHKSPSLDGTAERTTQKNLTSDRKRKFSQVYSKAQRQEPLRSQQDTSPEAHFRSDDTPSSGSASNSRRRIRSASSEDADIDMVGARLSSPPPTPTPPAVPKAAARTAGKVGMPFSPNTMQIWDTLLDPEDQNPKQPKPRQHEIPVRLARKPYARSKPQEPPFDIANTNGQRVIKLESSNMSTSKRPRRRLIDALVEQTKDDTDEFAAEVSDGLAESSQLPSSQTSDASILEADSIPTTPGPQPRAAQAKARTFARSGSALKYTYGQGRKVLEDEDSLLESLSVPEAIAPSSQGRRLELGDPQKLFSLGGALDDQAAAANGSPKTKIRDIHELRQAGANSRVADEMQDLAEQIGRPATKPSSSRRTALLRVAQDINNKNFMRQARDHGIDAAILKDIGREADVVSGYLVLSTLVTILTKWPSPHIIQLLHREDMGAAFSRLLKNHQDMKQIVRDRKNNLSKRSQAAVMDVETSLRQPPIWGPGATPTTISPRTLSIRCLHLLITQGPHLGRDDNIFSQGVIEGLFAVLSQATEDPDYFDYPASNGSIDLQGALSVLDVYAVSIANSQRDGSAWSSRFLPIVADVFGTSLKRVAQEDKTLESSILKLTINLTNNNLNAPDVFIAKDLVPALAGSVCSNFSQVLTSVSQDHWAEGILDGLVLRLGILINFSEHSVKVRQVTHECQVEGYRPIDEFIRLFLENYRRTAEADSVEKSHLNVVFGYLAVLLGHLCLHAPVRHRFRSSHAAKSMGPLLESMREFVHHHKTMESQLYGDEDGGSQGQSGWEGIEALAQQLEGEAAYD